MNTQKKRLLVFIVAYYAESTLTKVLGRIPQGVFETYDCEILVVDDGSEDRTFELGCQFRDSNPGLKITVLRNEFNQGYGGNQKIGYTYAIRERFDIVALLHGDAQYAPEELPKLSAPVAAGEAEAVFGSRMLQPGAALKGGMPLYKYLGNRILTTVQNRLLKSGLSEFHSGYRVYSVQALRKIRFLLNSNDFHFDTEIIIQLLNAKARILELPIPTYYGDEICRVNGIDYAKNVVIATLKNSAHRAGILYRRRYDPIAEDQYSELKLNYASSHSYAIEAVPRGSRVLDIGGNLGGIALELAQRGCTVHVIDRQAEISPHPNVTSEVQDLDRAPAPKIDGYSHILLLDVLEHLSDPEQFLSELRARFDHNAPTLVISVPNVAFFVQRLQLLFGQFNYGKNGILDRTHKRLFTSRSFQELLADEGFKIQEFCGVPAPFPKAIGDGMLGRWAVRANQGLIYVSKTLFSYQFFVVAKGTPDVNFLLKDAKERSALRASGIEMRPKNSSHNGVELSRGGT